MNWLPHFLNVETAAIAAAVAIPSLLLLYFLKLRRREMPISSTLLWKKAIQDLQVNAPFQKLRRNLLLLLQLLLLLILCLALARPTMNYSQGAGLYTVILIDRSASMSATDNGKVRLDEAKRLARDLVGTMARHSQAMVIAFDDSAQTVQSFTTDANMLRSAIDSITPTDRPTRLKLAYQLAEAQMAFIPAENRVQAARPDVWLFSDGRALDAGEVSLHANLHFEPIGSAASPNIAIVALSAKRNYEHPTQVQVFARLANYGPQPVQGVGVQLSVDGQVRSAGLADLLPERYTPEERDKAIHDGFIPRDSIQFTPMELESAAVIKVEQTNAKDDALAADNTAWVVVPPAKQLAVLVVTDGNYYIDKALQSMPLKKPDKITPADYKAKVPTDYDVIIFDGYSPDALPPAGGFIYFGAVPPGLKLKAAMDSGHFVMIRDATVIDWNRDHPILRQLLFSKLFASQQIKLLPTLDTEVLMEGSGGPLMVLHREGRGTHLVVAFNLLDSNWPLRASFPVFLQNALQYLAVGSDMDVRQSYQPGAAVRIPRVDLQKLDAMPKQVKLSGPGGDRMVNVPQAGDFALPPLDHVGIYSTTPAIPGFENIAVNLLDPNESDLIPADRAPGGEGDSTTVGNGKSRLELWWWLTAGGLGMLMVEWWVYTRRVHL